MNFDNLMKNQDILKILHDVLEKEETKNKLSVFSPNKELYGYNQYSLLIIMDFLVKYKIVIDDNNFLASTVLELDKIAHSYSSHKELAIWCNELLGELIKLKLGLEEKESYSAKREILSYLYDKYIVNGYLFHSFPSKFKSSVEENGIDPTKYKYPVNELKKTNYIFSNHKYDKILPKNILEKVTSISFTDSPALSYFYAFRSPLYFCDLTATSRYMKDEEKYDREAYYRKDYDACLRNMNRICEHLRMTENEKKAVLSSFSKQWKMLDASESFPCIAFIPRSEIGKNKLNDIEDILKKAKTEELLVGIARITDSRYPHIKRYSPLLPLSFTVKTMPSYREIKNNRLIERKKPFKESDIFIEIEEKPIKEIIKKPSVSYGYASVLCLTGLLFISLGITLLIIFNMYGIGG